MPDQTDPPECYADESSVQLPQICDRDIDSIHDPHEPPIGLGGGSLYVSWHRRLALGTQGPSSDPRPFKYRLADPLVQYRSVAVMRILTERGDGTARFKRYILPRAVGAQVLIWLHQLEWGSNTYPAVYEPQSAEAQILIKGDPLLIESDQPLRLSSGTYKNSRPFGFEHPAQYRWTNVRGRPSFSTSLRSRCAV